MRRATGRRSCHGCYTSFVASTSTYSRRPTPTLCVKPGNLRRPTGLTCSPTAPLEEYLKEWHTVMNDMSLHPDRREMLYIVVASPTSAAVPDLFFSGLPWGPGHDEDEPDREEDEEEPGA